LLGSKQQRAAAEDTLFTESVIMISLATLRVLNNIARLDLKILQVILRGRVTLLRLLYLVSYTKQFIMQRVYFAEFAVFVMLFDTAEVL